MLKIAAIKEYPIGSLRFPTKGTDGSAGWDFYLPKPSETFVKHFENLNHCKFSEYEELEGSGIVIPPHKRVVVPSGFKVCIEAGTAFIAWEKSGLATRYGLVPTAKVVDEDYQGEVGIGLLNTSDRDVFLDYGSKIAQFVHIPVIKDQLSVVDEKELYSEETERGTGGFGSTGV